MKRNLKKTIAYLLAIINLLIIATIGNNDVLIDLFLIVVFSSNCMLLLKYDHKYINKEELI